MKPRMFTAGFGAVLGLAGCATAPEGGGPGRVTGGVMAPASSAPNTAYGDFEYGWRDTAFYRDWYDATVFVLPPPTGSAANTGVKAAPARADSGGLREVDFDAAAGAR